MFRNQKLNKIIKNIVLLSVSSVVCIVCLKMPAYASYVLPYPSYMPGNKIYKISRIFDKVKKFWYFGNIAQLKYHLELSDKYLVEAKTLMEYNQYLLGADALIRSDDEFNQLPKYVLGLAPERVDSHPYQQLISEAANKHIEVLQTLLLETPKQFVWTPEKAKATSIPLHDDLEQSLALRKKVSQLIIK